MQKVAVVSGSAKGLGKDIALALADCNFAVVVHYRKSAKEAKEVLKSIRVKSPKSDIVSGDLTDERQVKKIFGGILKKFGCIDLLVNNVGDFLYKDFEKTSNEEFKNIIESNLYSALFCSRAVLPLMRKQKGGNIINIGSVGADRLVLRAKSAPYFIAKNSVYALTKVMAYEEAKYGIRVNMISPGSMAADIFKPGDFPMGRPALHKDVIKALLFLISKEARYISGANVEVAGAFIPGYNSQTK